MLNKKYKLLLSFCLLFSLIMIFSIDKQQVYASGGTGSGGTGGSLSVSYNLINVSGDGSNPTTYTENSSIVCNFVADDGYELPLYVTILCGVDTLMVDTDYSWTPDNSTDMLIIYPTVTSIAATSSLSFTITISALEVLSLYDVTFEENGGSTVTDSFNVAVIPTELPVPSKLGYTFEGWYTDSGLTTEATPGATLTSDITLYASYDYVSYFITYYLDGGTNHLSHPASYRIIDHVVLYDPEKEGKSFNGWFTEATFVNQVEEIVIGSTGSKSFYAQWINVINYNSNGGTNVSNDVDVNVIPTLPTSTKMGYTLEGWYYDSNFVLKATAGETITTNITLYAKWVANNYVVSLNAGDGTVSPTSVLVAYNSSYSNLPTPSAPQGYEFSGWVTAMTEGTQVTNNTVVLTASDHTIYAQYEELVSYTISFILDGGTLITNPISRYVGYPYNFETPVKTNYVFGGYYEDLSDSSTKVLSNQLVTSDKTLYAKWLDTYSITYIEGEVCNMSALDVEHAATIPTLPILSQLGYTFNGWYLDNEFNNQAIPGTTLSSNLTLYAKWSVTNYTITYVLNGGTNNTNNALTYRYIDHVELYDPEKEGSCFYGWYTESTFVNQVEEIVINSTGNKTFYAKFGYTVTYVTNCSTSVAMAQDQTALVLPTLVKPGYTLEGWYYNDTFTNQAAVNDSIATNTTVYCKWTPNTYTVTFDSNYEYDTDTTQNYTNGTQYGTLSTPTRTNYVFVGWFTSVNFTTQIKANTTVNLVDNTTFYAKWTKQYLITFDPNGGNAIENNTKLLLSGSQYGTLPTPIRTNYRFSGWYRYISDGTVNVTANSIFESSVDVTLYANWIREYSITYVLNGAINDQRNPATYIESDLPISLYDPTGSNNIFIGWSSGDEYAEVITTPGDVTLTAIFRAPITFVGSNIVYKNKNAVLTTATIQTLIQGYFRCSDSMSISVSQDNYVGHGADVGDYTIIFRAQVTADHYYDQTITVRVMDLIVDYIYRYDIYFNKNVDLTKVNLVSVCKTVGLIPNVTLTNVVISSDYYDPSITDKLGNHNCTINYESSSGLPSTNLSLVLHVSDVTTSDIVETTTTSIVDDNLIYIVGGIILFVVILMTAFRFGKGGRRY